MDSEIYSKYEIIDAHAHIFPEKIAENATVNIGHFYDLPMESCGMSKQLIQSGDKIGVKNYLVCSTATTPHQISSINEFIARECRQNPSFYGLGTTHPDSENIEADIQQIKSLGLHGVKLHPDFQNFDADSPKAFEIYEILQGDMPLLIHCGDRRYDRSAPHKIAKIHKNFPRLKLHSAHFGGYQRWSEAEECLAGLENVVFDISSSMAFLAKDYLRHLISKYGAENCFFGSDFPMWSHEEELRKLLELGLTERENRLILSEGFKNFYGLE